jgi:hypothetical protein
VQFDLPGAVEVAGTSKADLKRRACPRPVSFRDGQSAYLAGLVCHFDSRLLGIEQAHEAAKARGGRCLSEHYVASLSKLTWLCHRGHEWRAPLSAVRVGKWCKRCASMDRISNTKSGARIRYSDAGAKLIG